MVTRPVDPNAVPEDELVFASLIDELADRIRAGNAIPWEDLRRDHLQWIGRIEELMPMIRILANGSETDCGRIDSDETIISDMRMGDYRLIRPIGRGGMGVVYEALEVPLKRRVAIKLLATDLVESDRARIRFENEALAAARLKHPNIVPVYAIGELNGRLYYAMPFIDGMTLSELRDRARRQYFEKEPAASVKQLMEGRDWPAFVLEVARIGQQIAQALDAAHESGVVHRDIKPSNIMIEPTGHVWILDFGLARLESQKTMTETGEIVGTLRYMSPERLSNASDNRLDRRADVYSLGATLYELLALSPPFSEYPQAALYKAIVSSSPKSLSKSQLPVPDGLVRVVEKAMERDPRDRYPSCADFAKDLSRAMHGEQVKAKKTPALMRTKRYVQGHPMQFIAASIATLLLVTIVLSAITWRRELAMVQSKNLLQEQLLGARADELRSKELFLTVNDNREQRTNPQAGWQRKGIQGLSEAARYARQDNEKLLVRNELAASWKERDLEWSQTLLQEKDIYTCQWSRDGKCLAVGLNLPSEDRNTLLLLRGDGLQERIEVELPSSKMLGEGDDDTMGVRTMVFSHDGTTLYCGTRTGVLHAVEVATGKVLRSRCVLPDAIFGLDVSPDDEQLALGGESKLLRLIFAKNFDDQDELAFEAKIVRVFWGNRLLVLADGLKQLAYSNDKLIVEKTIVPDSFSCGSFFNSDAESPGFAMPHADGIRIYEQNSGELLRTFRYGNRDEDATPVQSSTFCLSPTADLLFTSDTRNVRIWDYGSGELALQIPIAGNSAVGVAVDPQGKTVVVWGDNQLNLYHLPQRVAFGTTPGRLRTVDKIALDTVDPGGPVLVDQFRKIIYIGDQQISRTYTTMSRPWQPQWDHTPVFFDSYDVAMTYFDRLLLIWSSQKKQIASHDVRNLTWNYQDLDLPRVRWLRIAPDRRMLYVAMDELIPGKRAGVRTTPLLKTISTHDWTIQWEWREPGLDPENPSAIMDMQFDGDALACLMEDGRGVWIDSAKGETRSSVSIPFVGVQNFCWVGDHQWAIGTTEGRVGVYDTETQSVAMESNVHRMPVTGVACMKDGTIVSCCKDGNLVFSKVDSGQLREVLRVSYDNAAIEEMHLDSERDLLFYRCRNEHLGRWLEIDRLREEFVKLGIDW